MSTLSWSDSHSQKSLFTPDALQLEASMSAFSERHEQSLVERVDQIQGSRRHTLPVFAADRVALRAPPEPYNLTLHPIRRQCRSPRAP